MTRKVFRSSQRRPLHAPSTWIGFTLAAVVACSVYTPELLTGDGGTDGSGATGAAGDGGESTSSGGEAGSSGSSGTSGKGGAGGSSGTSGAGTAGTTGGTSGSAGAGGSAGKGGSSSGNGGSAGTAAGAGGTSSGTAGDGGAGETGAGGEAPNCTAPDDCCPSDPNKTEPGLCGCGVAETDTDSDSTPNCLDGCPSDPNKVGAGECGCGFPDVVDGCLGLRDALVHRYSFDGSGTEARDTAGTAHGTIVNTTITGTGSLLLSGTTSDQYVDLGSGLVSGLTDATFEVWTTWNGGNAWQRILDFGSSTNGPGMQGNGETYLFLTPRGGSGASTLRATFTIAGTGGETVADGPAAVPTGAISHIAVVFDDTNDTLGLYLNGVSVASATSFTGQLSTLIDENVWLGRSNYSADPEYGGTLHEFRIYSAALNAAQLQTSFASGPDATFF